MRRAGEDDDRSTLGATSVRCCPTSVSQCHGPGEEAREGGFRLDDKESALGEADSGEHPIVPGDLEQSELYQRSPRTTLTIACHRKTATRSLTKRRLPRSPSGSSKVRPWQGHWAYMPPRKAAAPEVQATDWPREPIDHFVLARLEKQSLDPAAAGRQDHVDPTRYLRSDGLAADAGRGRTVSGGRFARCLRTSWSIGCWLRRTTASTWHGSGWMPFATAIRTGCIWTTIARCGPIAIGWCGAFNANMPFDQFTIEQLAGDLLPNPTDEQLIATGLIAAM